jgi:hypothetical protein
LLLLELELLLDELVDVDVVDDVVVDVAEVVVVDAVVLVTFRSRESHTV